MVIWQDVAVAIRNKEYHVRKMYGKLYFAFINTYGDLPRANINEITHKAEAVVNTRGRAYAARKRQAYRKDRREIVEKKFTSAVY